MTAQEVQHPVVARFKAFVEAGFRSLIPSPVKRDVKTDVSPDPIPESVNLIYPSDPDHALLASQPPLAAAFVLRVHDPDEPSKSNLFLVTARHAVDPRWARCAKQNPNFIEIRLNRSIGGVGYEAVLLQNNSKPTFLTPSDPTVDLALVPLDSSIIANLGEYKLLEMSFDDVLTSTDLVLLRKDMPVRTAGYPASSEEAQVSYPTRDLGSIAEMSNDVTEVSCSGHDLGQQQHQDVACGASRTLRHLWFINAGARTGLMGAPVLVDLDRAGVDGSNRVLLGVQSDSWTQKSQVGITPAYFLRDLVRSALPRKASSRTSLQGSILPGNQKRSNEQMLTEGR